MYCWVAAAGAVGLLVAVLVKIYAKLTCGWYEITEDLSDKTVLITGANTGIGKVTALELAKAGATVHLLCRNKQKADIAAEDIKNQSNNYRIHVWVVDTSSFRSVRWAELFISVSSPTDILVGCDRIKETAPARIVVVSSLVHRLFTLRLEDVSNNPGGYWTNFKHYGLTKLANVIFANELSRRLENTGVTVNSLHPGAVNTGLFGWVPNIGQVGVKLLGLFFKKVASPLALTPKEEPGTAPVAPPIGVGSDGDSIQLEARILELCREFPDGITSPDLEQKTGSVNQEQRTGAINKLLSAGKIEIKTLGLGGTLLFKLKSEESLEKLKGATQEETLVYNLIEDAKTKGIWVRDIVLMSNLPRKQLNKILKSLESKKLVKSIKAIGASKRKEVYMLYELAPDPSLTGGAFYADQEFDAQFVDILNTHCRRFLKNCEQRAKEKYPDDIMERKDAASVTSLDVCQHIKDLKLSRVELTVDDVEKILNTLVFDGVAEKLPFPHVKQGREYQVFRAVEQALPPPGMVRVPCTFCPVFKDCRPGGEVSPASCEYFKDWLDEI